MLSATKNNAQSHHSQTKTKVTGSPLQSFVACFARSPAAPRGASARRAGRRGLGGLRGRRRSGGASREGGLRGATAGGALGQISGLPGCNGAEGTGRSSGGALRAERRGRGRASLGRHRHPGESPTLRQLRPPGASTAARALRRRLPKARPATRERAAPPPRRSGTGAARSATSFAAGGRCGPPLPVISSIARRE